MSYAGYINAAHGKTLSPSQLRTLILLLADDCNESNSCPPNAETSFDEFIHRLQQLDLPDSYRWQLVELSSHWDNHQQVVEDILARGTALFNEVVHLAQPLIDQWYDSLQASLTTQADHTLHVGRASIRLSADRDYSIYPALESCNGTAAMIFEPSAPTLPFFAGRVFYGVLCDPIAARIEQLQQGDNALLRGLRALGDKQRLLIFRALAEAPRYSGELVKLTGLSPATISHHMGELLRAGLVDMEDAGSRVVYHIDQNGLTDLADAVRALI